MQPRMNRNVKAGEYGSMATFCDLQKERAMQLSASPPLLAGGSSPATASLARYGRVSKPLASVHCSPVAL